MTYFDKLFTASVTCIELNRCEPREFCAHMCTSCLADTRRARDHHAAKVVHTIFAWLLKISFQTVRPRCMSSVDSVEFHERHVNSPVVEPLLELLDLPFVAANLFECLRSISIGPELHLRVFCLGPVSVSI